MFLLFIFDNPTSFIAFNNRINFNINFPIPKVSSPFLISFLTWLGVGLGIIINVFKMNDYDPVICDTHINDTLPDKMTVNPVTLRFNGYCIPLESCFARDDSIRVQRMIYAALFIGGVICIFLGIIELVLIPFETVKIIAGIRSGIILLVGFLYALTRIKFFSQYSQIIVSFCAFSCGLLLILTVMVGPAITQNIYFVLYFLIYLVSFIIIRIRFIYSIITGAGMYICYLIATLYIFQSPFENSLINLLFLLLTLIVSVWAAYYLEYDARKRFFLAYQLKLEKEKTAHMVVDLESRVQTRTQELSSSNTRLMIEIAERKQAQNEYVYIATHDSLTKLPNRSLMRDRLRHALSRARRNGSSLAVLFVDLDGFKAVNDAYSHNCGDNLLKLVSERLAKCLRDNDTISRFGGDEFVILIEGTHKKSDSAEVARKILSVIEQPFNLDIAEVFISASIGISLYPEHGSTADALLKNADLAMYQAKKMGKNCYRYYSEHISEKFSNRAVLGAQLRKALLEDEFYLLYQPQVHLGTGKIVGVEALIRWRHPKMGSLAPSKFIPVAEETGLIVPIGEWAIKTACNQINLWQTMGLPPIRVAINISGRQLKESDFVERFEKILNETHVSPEMIELELTESVVFHYTGDNQILLQRLKKHGVQLAVDDFGQGYSTLSHLARLPFDKLKMDKAFADNIALEGNDSVVAAGIINIANRLGMVVVAEGVETKEQLVQYEMQGCNHVQGWIFSRAVEADQIGDMLAKGVFDNYRVRIGEDHGMEGLV